VVDQKVPLKRNGKFSLYFIKINYLHVNLMASQNISPDVVSSEKAGQDESSANTGNAVAKRYF
jgi:hypothetical protein